MNGTVTTPDATDTPEQSASYSLNLDCVNKDGALQGAPINTTLTIRNKDDDGNASPDIDKAVVIKRNESDVLYQDVVYWDEGDNKLNFIKNRDGKRILNDSASAPDFSKDDGVSLTSTVLNDVAMETHNKEVHIGFGNNNNPYWVGYTNHRSLTSSSGTLLVEEAEVKYPSSVPHLKKTVRANDDHFVYGIKEGGTRIWKLNAKTGAFVANSASGTFANLQSIATDGAGKLYILDRQGKGVVYRVLTTDLNVKEKTYTLPLTYPGPDGSNYSDIEYTATNTKIWVAAHWNNRAKSDTDITNQFLWNFTDDGTTETKSIDAKMPRLSGGSITTQGTWVSCVQLQSGSISANNFSVHVNHIEETYPRSLVKHPQDAAAIYWLARYQDFQDPDPSGNEALNCRPMWLYKSTADLAGSGNNREKMESVAEVRTLCLHRIKNDHTSGTDFVPLIRVYHPNNADSGNGGNSLRSIDSCGIEENTERLFLTIGSTVERLSAAVPTSWVDNETSAPYNLHNLGTITTTVYNVTPSGQDARTDISVNFGFQPATDETGTFSGNTSSLALLRGSGTAGIDTIAKDYAANATQTLLKDHSVITIDPTDSGEDSSNSGDLQAGYGYWYKMSLLYDGYQETPLCTESFAFDQHATEKYNRVSKITINDTSQIPKRASAINVYRAEAESTSATTPFSLFRLVDTVSLASGWTLPTDLSANISFTDKGYKGASYEASSGLSETIEATLPRYSLSAQLNNQHYIGKCYHEGYVDDATSYIFASKVGKFDVFDWVVDFIKLPTVPTALIGFSGRLYAFDETNTYKLVGSPGLYIEDIFEGVGCLNDDAIVSTDYGMFFADNQNLYWHNGQVAEPIGESIARGADTAWQNRDTAYHTRAMYDAKRRSVYFTFKKGNNYYAWAWNIPRKRWDLLSFGDTEGTAQPKGNFLMADGSINVSDGSSVVGFLGHASTKRTWTWTSKNLTMGNDTQEKNIRSILLPSRIKAAYNVASGDITSAGSQVNATPKRGTYRLDIASADRKTTTFKVRLDANAAGDECGSLGVLFKTKRSPR